MRTGPAWQLAKQVARAFEIEWPGARFFESFFRVATRAARSMSNAKFTSQHAMPFTSQQDPAMHGPTSRPFEYFDRTSRWYHLGSQHPRLKLRAPLLRLVVTGDGGMVVQGVNLGRLYALGDSGRSAA